MPSYFDAPKSHKIYPTDSVEGLADVREALKLFAGRQVHVTYKTPGHTFRDESNNLCTQRGKKLINETWKVPDLKQGFSGWWRQVSKSYKFWEVPFTTQSDSVGLSRTQLGELSPTFSNNSD